jgi:L-methionine (R)-S-oxide reductase
MVPAFGPFRQIGPVPFFLENRDRKLRAISIYFKRIHSMQEKVKLSEIINGMDFGADESGYLNKKTGKVVIIFSDDSGFLESDEPLESLPQWQREAIAESRELMGREEDVIALPSKFDIHEYAIMEKFCLSLKDEKASTQLYHAIKGSGAFRRFKDGIHRLNIADQWYRYRDRALKEIAVQWCEDNQVDYLDDVSIPDEKQFQIEKKIEQYAELENQLQRLIKDEHDLIANAANAAALIYHNLPEVNWAGFYFLKDEQLVLGPFQGKPACTRIALGKGVCGTAAAQRKTIVVPDVKKFPGHIACDAASSSEIVVPLIKQEKLLGVLDIDSPALGRFNEQDQKGLERLGQIFMERINP